MLVLWYPIYTMKVLFVKDKTRKQVSDRFDWACVVEKYNDGFMIFESEDDYDLWKLNYKNGGPWGPMPEEVMI